MAMVRSNFYIDGDTLEGIKYELPRRVSASSIVRLCLVAAITNDREFDKYMRDHPEAREIKDWLRPKLRKLVD